MSMLEIGQKGTYIDRRYLTRTFGKQSLAPLAWWRNLRKVKLEAIFQKERY